MLETLEEAKATQKKSMDFSRIQLNLMDRIWSQPVETLHFPIQPDAALALALAPALIVCVTAMPFNILRPALKLTTAEVLAKTETKAWDLQKLTTHTHPLPMRTHQIS